MQPSQPVLKRWGDVFASFWKKEPKIFDSRRQALQSRDEIERATQEPHCFDKMFPYLYISLSDIVEYIL